MIKENRWEVNIVEILKAIIKHFSIFVVIILLSVIIGIVLAFTLPKKYTSTALLFPPTPQEIYPVSGISQGYLTEWGVTGGLLGGTSLSDVFIGVMKSRAVKEKVIKECSLRIILGKKASRKLNKMTNLSITKEMLISIEITSKDPKLAARIANSYVDNLDYFMKHRLITKGREIREFLELRLKEEREKLNKLMRGYERATAPFVPSLYSEKVSELEANIEVYKYLVQQYEQAKLMEVQNTPLVTVVQKAKPPKIPSWPNKPVIVVVMFVIGIITATITVIIIYKFKEIRKEVKNVRRSSK